MSRVSIEAFRDQCAAVQYWMDSLSSCDDSVVGNESGRVLSNVRHLESLVLMRRNPEAEARRSDVIAQARALVQARTSKAPANDRY